MLLLVILGGLFQFTDALLNEHSSMAHWSEWWTCIPHLWMLTEVFQLKNAPRNTNGVERVNQDSKECCQCSFLHSSREKSYRNQTDEGRCNAAASRKRQHLQNVHKDEDSQFSPPDKRGHFCAREKHLQIGQRVEVKYDDDVWYAGTLTEYSMPLQGNRLQYLIAMVIQHLLNFIS